MTLGDPTHNLLYDPRLKEDGLQKTRERFLLLDTLSECEEIDYLLSSEYSFLPETKQREYFEQEFRKQNKLPETFTFERLKPIIHNNKIIAKENIESRILQVIEDLKHGQDSKTGGWDLISQEDLIKSFPARTDEIRSLTRSRFANAWAVATCIRALLKWRAYMSDTSVDPYVAKGISWLRTNKTKERHGTVGEGLDSLPAELGPSDIKIYDTSYGILAFLYAPPEAGGSIENVPYLDTVVRHFSLEDRCWLLDNRPDVGATSYSLYTLMRYYEKCNHCKDEKKPGCYLGQVKTRIHEGVKWLLENRVNGVWSNSSSPV